MTKGSGFRRQAECASERHRYLVCAVSAGIQTWNVAVNPSASLLRDWLEHGIFVWLVTDKLLSEYKAILKRLCMRRHPVGQIINTLREKAKFVNLRGRPWEPPRVLDTLSRNGIQPQWASEGSPVIDHQL